MFLINSSESRISVSNTNADIATLSQLISKDPIERNGQVAHLREACSKYIGCLQYLQAHCGENERTDLRRSIRIFLQAAEPLIAS